MSDAPTPGTPAAGEHPDLLGLLRGQLTNAEVAAADDHLDGCGDCREELRHLVVGHALLTRSAATVRPARPEVTTAAPLAPPPLPVRPVASGHRPGRVARVLAAAAAVVALVAGTAVTTARLVETDEPGGGPVAGVTGRLSPVEGAGTGEVLMAERGRTVVVTIRTHDLPRARSGEFYYAWLLEPSTNKMLPLGQVGPGGSASFELPDSLVDRYVAVDVSLEDDDGDPAHSVTSVLRGDYTPPTRAS
ncbi:MAG: anti-sigma factor [Nocardioidaceae bacterium]